MDFLSIPTIFLNSVSCGWDVVFTITVDMNPANRREPLSERPIDGRGIPHTGRLDYSAATAHLNNVTSTLSNPQANHGFVSSVLNSHVRPEFQ